MAGEAADAVAGEAEAWLVAAVVGEVVPRDVWEVPAADPVLVGAFETVVVGAPPPVVAVVAAAPAPAPAVLLDVLVAAWWLLLHAAANRLAANAKGTNRVNHTNHQARAYSSTAKAARRDKR